MPRLGQRIDPVERFLAKVNITDSCWLWTAGLNQYGYGKFFVSSERKFAFAHRFAWETFVGPIPEGLVLDHVHAAGCTSVACVNPDHLEPVTQRINVLRGHHSALKTHCANGHPFTPENLYVSKHGGRRCRLCCLEITAAKREGREPVASYKRSVPTKDHCKYGHPFDATNTLISSGVKYCRACIRSRKARYAARKAA